MKNTDLQGYDTFSPKNQATMKKIYDYYATLFKNNSNLMWAGMAKLAGNVVWQQLMNPPYVKGAAAAAGGIGGALGIPGGGMLAEQAAQKAMAPVIAQLMTMNKEIFEDLAWMHQAYVTGGIAEITQLHDAGEIPDDIYQAWLLIDSGDPANVKKGNAILLQREQQIVLKRGYAALSTMSVGPVSVATIMSRNATNPIPGGKDFLKTVPSGNLTNYNDRWKWITTQMLPIWNAMDNALRQKLVAQPLGTSP